MSAIRVGILGCGGRMGRMLLAEAIDAGDLVLAGGIERPGDAAVGRDLGELAGRAPIGIPAGTDSRVLFAALDVAIDFSAPAATLVHVGIAAATGKAIVIGTTGIDATQAEAIEDAAVKAPILWAANMSDGVTLALALIERTAKALGPDYDIEIVEMHHRHKVDAPSGTALAMGRAAAKGRNVALDSVWRKSRDGITGERPKGEIGFASLRGGDVVGDHAAIFAGPGERIEIAHKASSRQVFAQGALRAARWVAGRKPGLYSMRDVLGLD